MATQGVPCSQEISCATISRKDLATISWDSEGVLLLEFMPHKTTITGDTYASTIVALRENIKQKRRGKLSAGVLLLHDNAPAHRGLLAIGQGSSTHGPGRVFHKIQCVMNIEA